MAKIPFDVKFRPQIESGEYKVETIGRRPVRIICWDKKTGGNDCIVALVTGNGGEVEKTIHYDCNGFCISSGMKACSKNLFIITPEPELTDWEKFISGCLQKHGLLDCGAADRIAKECSTELLNLAREEFVKQGYVIEKKAFHDAVEKISPKVMEEASRKIDLANFIQNLSERYSEVSFAKLTRIAKASYDYGKAEALKDLPRWKKIRDNGCVDADGDTYTDCLCLLKRGWYQVMSPGTKVGGEIRYLPIRDLEKLPDEEED